MLGRGAIAGGDSRTDCVSPMNAVKRRKSRGRPDSSRRANREIDEPNAHSTPSTTAMAAQATTPAEPARGHGRQAARSSPASNDPINMLALPRATDDTTRQQRVPMGLPPPSTNPHVDHPVRYGSVSVHSSALSGGGDDRGNHRRNQCGQCVDGDERDGGTAATTMAERHRSAAPPCSGGSRRLC